MTASNISLGSSTDFSKLQLSGTQFTNQSAAQIVLMCGLSGLALIPIRVDSTGRCGSIDR